MGWILRNSSDEMKLANSAIKLGTLAAGGGVKLPTKTGPFLNVINWTVLNKVMIKPDDKHQHCRDQPAQVCVDAAFECDLQ